MDYENIDALRATGAVPHWFGLGFIQLKLDAETRMHFWHPDLAADVPDEEIHNHRYDFSSKLLRGRLRNIIYEFDGAEKGAHELVAVSCKPGDAHEPEVLATGHVRTIGYVDLAAGSTYTMRAEQFHRIETTNAVTLLRRGQIISEMAKVVRPVGAAAVCPFARQIPEAKLWDYMADALGALPSPGYHTRRIAKGVLGETSKIKEELEELEDAMAQDVKVMALIEASDLYGALEAFLVAKFPTVTMADIAAMSRVTKRAFANGSRT